MNQAINTPTDAVVKAIANFSTELTAGNTKATMSAIGAKSSDLWKVKPGDINVLPDYNARLPGPNRTAHVRWLADQIKTYGFYADKPLAGFVAQEGGKQVIYLQDGHCRLEAAIIAISEGAPLETLPMVMKDRSSSMVDLTVALLNSNEGKAFTVLEKALIAKRFKNFGLEDKQVAEKMGCTSAYVGQLLTLAGAPRKIRDLLQAGDISATNAIETIRKHGDKAGEALETAVVAAKSAGKSKATAKDDKASRRVAREKKLAAALFKAVRELLDNKAVVKVIPDALYKELDTLVFKAENEPVKEPKEPKKPAAKKAVKAPAAKKVPLAKKIAKATAAKKAK